MEAITAVSVPVVIPKNQGKAAIPLKRPSSDAQPIPKPRTAEGQIDKKLAEADARRLERLRQAADTFVVSDQSFTMYKDATTGQFITRFTSLRDGKVTYIPEPDLVAWLNQSKQIDPSLSLDV